MLLNYRKDIDGLRAIAVLLVVLFHAGFAIPGGFIGVDIFFVISGFLIASLIQKQILRDKFTFKGFYVHRIRRILPAMLFVMIITLAVCWFFLMPSHYILSIRSFSYSIIQSSNFYYLTKVGDYFAKDTDQMQFLHTWSLSVETQFYIIIPFLLLALFKFFYKTKYFNLILVLLTVIFIVISEYMAKYNPNAAYYLLPARMYELLMGVVLALNYSKIKTLDNKYFNNILGVIALLLIFIPAFLITKESTFPGLNALFPCLGAALIIYLGKLEKLTLTTKLLSIKPMVALGLISYSLYLWHWPIIATFNIIGLEFSNLEWSAILIVMIILSALTWKFIEQPFRHKFKWSMLKTVIILLLIPAVLGHFFKVYSKKTDGYIEYRFPKESISIITSAENRAAHVKSLCMEAIRTDSDYSPEKCIIGDSSRPSPDVLLYGDSHANSISGFLDKLLQDANLRGYPLANYSYLYLTNKWTKKEDKEETLKERRKILKVIENTISKGNYKYVVISGYYKGAVVMYGDDKPEEGLNTLYEGLQNTIELIISRGSIPIIIKDVPNIVKNDNKCLIFKQIYGGGEDCFKPLSEVKQEHKKYEEIFIKLAKEYPSLKYIDPKDSMCDNEKCYIDMEGISFYMDAHHLNYPGSQYLGDRYLKLYKNPFKTTNTSKQMEMF